MWTKTFQKLEFIEEKNMSALNDPMNGEGLISFSYPVIDHFCLSYNLIYNLYLIFPKILVFNPVLVQYFVNF